MDSPMLILVSGEGSTDIGVASPGITGLCPPGSWEPGPMALFIDRFVEKFFNFSPLDCYSMWLINETSLNAISKKIKPMQASRDIYFKKNSKALLAVSYKLSKETECDVLPILFRDTDGSQSQQRKRLWTGKRKSIANCINPNEMYVCPMLPNPKSEAWLLCPLKNNYNSCARLECLSGNDASPNSAKALLQECLNEEVSREVLNKLIENGNIDPNLINMPSINVYKKDMQQVVCRRDKISNLASSLLKEFDRVTTEITL